jgi:hypothetical protein
LCKYNSFEEEEEEEECCTALGECKNKIKYNNSARLNGKDEYSGVCVLIMLII